LPENISERKQFAKLFRQFNDYLEAAKVQGFVWDKTEYLFTNKETGELNLMEVYHQ